MLTAEMLKDRATGSMIIADLAVPRDVDPLAGELPGVTLIDIDHLQDLRDRHGLAEALAAAAGMVDEATREWQTWCRTRAAVPMITDLRAHVDRQRDAELVRTLAHLEHLPEADRAIVEEMAHRLVNKMFHHLAIRMKKAAADPDLGDQYLEAVRFLFLTGETALRDDTAQEQSPQPHGVG
jgi:glutamyl-tRNA reductase